MMDKAVWIVILSVVVLGGFALVITPAGDMVGTFAQDTFGFSTMSLTQANLQSNFAPLNGQAWLLTFRIGGLSQSANFVTDTVTASDVKAYSTSFPRDSFKLDVKLDSQTCNYDILGDSALLPVYDLKFVEWNEFGACDFSQASVKCGGATPLAGWTQSFDLSGKCNVVCGTQLATVGRVGSPQINSAFTVGVSRNGVLDASKSFQTLYSDDKAFDVSGLVGSNVFVQWQGDLSSGRACPSSSAVVPIYYGGKYITVSSSRYDDYKSSYNALGVVAYAGSLAQFSAGTTDEQAESYVSSVNSKKSLVLGQVNLASGQSISGAKIVVPVDSVTFPVLTAYVKATWIGIVTPTGKPDITALSSPCFDSGMGSVSVSVKNVGDEAEQFSISAVCPSGFSVENSDIFLRAGESGTKILKITGSTGETILRKSCTLTVKGLAYSDSQTFEACVNPLRICTPNKNYCIGSNVEKCNSAGSDYDPVRSCSGGCLLDAGGVPFCGEDNDNQSRCTPFSTICQGNEVMKCNLLGTGYALETTCASPLVCAVDLNKVAKCSVPNQTCDDRFLGLVKGELGVKDDCGFLCKIGLKPAEKVNVCVYNYTPLIVVGIFVLGLTAILVFGLRGRGKKAGRKGGKSSAEFLKSKTFWGIVAGIVGIILLFAYFKYVFWLIVGAVVLLIVDAIFLKGKIRNKLLG